MNNKKRDVKFIIYQALYIFVVCIVAIKGANLDLTEVDEKIMLEPGWTYVDTTNKVLIDRDELAKLIHIDTTKYMIVSIDDWDKKHPDIPQPIITTGGLISSGLTDPKSENTNTSNNPPTEDPVKKPPPTFGSMQLVQYRNNIVNNKNGYPIKVNGVTVNANSNASVLVGSESSILVTWDGGSQTFGTILNKKPEIKIIPVTSMGENSKASQLQRTTCFRVTISDDYPEQLDVKFSGPVTVKQKDKNTYDITMNFFGSTEAFKNFTDTHESPYHVGFNVIVKDKIAPHSVTAQQQFVFGEW